MVAGPDDFLVVAEGRFVVVHTQVSLKGTGGGQDGECRKLPGVDVAEPANGFFCVAITGFPGTALDGVGTEVDQTERAASGTEKKEAAIGSVDEGIDPVDGVSGGCAHRVCPGGCESAFWRFIAERNRIGAGVRSDL